MLPRSEDELIRWLRRRLASERPELVGDDAALLPESRAWAVSVDQQVEGVHFPPGLDPAVVGRRLVAVGLSDLAASGARPSYALLALAMPRGYDPRPLLEGLLSACRRWRLRLAGGDVSRAPRLCLSLTVLGRRVPGGRWVRRAGARPGDGLWLSGSAGEAALGRLLIGRGARLRGRSVHLPPDLALPARAAAAARRLVRRHLLPVPRLELGEWLSRRRRAAAIDLSDGLALDLHRLCRESRVGARIEAAALTPPPPVALVARLLGRDPLRLVLGGGEDYELLFALPRGTRPPGRLGSRRIGRVERKRELLLVQADGARALDPAGWDHLAGFSAS